MRVSSKELFSTLKNLPGLDQSSFQLAKKLLSLTELHQRTKQRLTTGFLSLYYTYFAP